MADYSTHQVRKQVNITVNGLELFFYPTNTLDGYNGTGNWEAPTPGADLFKQQQQALFRWKHMQSYLAGVGILATPTGSAPLATAVPATTNTIKIVYLPETARWFPALSLEQSYVTGQMASGPVSTEDPAHEVRRALVDTNGSTWHDPAFWGPAGDVNTDIGIARVLRAHLMMAFPPTGGFTANLPTYNETYGKDTQPYGGGVFTGLGRVEYLDVFVPSRAKTPGLPSDLTVTTPASNPTDVPFAG